MAVTRSGRSSRSLRDARSTVRYGRLWESRAVMSFFIFAMGDDEILAEQFVVIADDFLKRILLEDCASELSTLGSNKRGHVHLRRTFANRWK